MALGSSRLLPYTEVRLYDPGEGDPAVTQSGFAFTDAIGHSRAVGGTFTRFATGQAHLEVQPELGLCCAPVVVAQDTRLAHYSRSGGVWDEVLPAAGSPRRYRLAQLSTAPGVVWYAESISALPANPALAVSLILPSSPPDWDATVYPPRVEVQLGTAADPDQAWLIRLEKGRAALLGWDGGGWTERATLPLPAGGGYRDLQEQWLLVRCLAGRVLFSLDGGASYTVVGSPESPAGISSGPLRLAGQGGMCLFGVHQVRYAQGDYTCAPRDTLTSRIGHSPVVDGFAHTGDGGSVSYHDEGDARYAAYRARITPAGTTWLGPGWDVYHTPVITGVTYRIPPVVRLASESYSTPWSDRVTVIEITKPRDLAESECRLRIKLPAGSTWSGGYRRRKVRVTLGWRDTGSAETVTWTAFVGYIRSVTLTRGRYGGGYAEIIVDNAAAKLRRQRWSDLQVQSLAGLTVAEASDLVLESFGMPTNPSYREWHAAAGLVTIPAGEGAEPGEQIRAGETAWETLIRLQSYAGLEVGVTDDGVLKSVPPSFSTGVLHEASATGVDDLRLLVQSVEVATDYDETGTAVLVAGRDAAGQRQWAWAVDTEAETQPLSDRYCPWRELEYDEVPGVSHPALLLGRAQVLAQETFGLVTLADTGLHLSPLIARRDTVRLNGFAAEGLPDGSLLRVLSIQQRVDVMESGLASMEQRVGLQLL